MASRACFPRLPGRTRPRARIVPILLLAAASCDGSSSSGMLLRRRWLPPGGCGGLDWSSVQAHARHLGEGWRCARQLARGAGPNPHTVLLALRGGAARWGNAGEPTAPEPSARCTSHVKRVRGGSDASVGRAGGDDGKAEDNEDFSLGAVSDGLARTQSEGAGQARASLDDATAASAGEVEGHDEKVDGVYEGETSGEADDDDEDIAECQFERIGDTNGVFYFLGLQAVGAPTGAGTTLPAIAGVPGAAGPGGVLRRRFQNPALTGRVQVKTGPKRIMCSSKLKGRMSCPEDVLERNVVGDQFHFPDGWVAFDLGRYTTLRPSHYMVRNGGAQAHDKIMTGWVLEGATYVKGEYWRQGDWVELDRHTNDTCFRELALQAEADGSAAGYLHETGTQRERG